MRGTFIYEDGKTGNTKSDLLQKLVEAAKQTKKTSGESSLTRVVEKIASQKPKALREVLSEIVDNLAKPLAEEPSSDGLLGSDADLMDETNGVDDMDGIQVNESDITRLVDEIKLKLQELEDKVEGLSSSQGIPDELDVLEEEPPEQPGLGELPDDIDVEEETTKDMANDISSSNSLTAPLDKSVGL